MTNTLCLLALRRAGRFGSEPCHEAAPCANAGGGARVVRGIFGENVANYMTMEAGTGTNPQVVVLVLTMYEVDDSDFAGRGAAPRGYLLNGAQRAETLAPDRALSSAEAIFGPAADRRRISSRTSIQPNIRIFSELTDREREILALIAQGRRNEEIAARLLLSIKTVRNHASNIFSKLQVVDRTQAAIRAREAGLA